MVHVIYLCDFSVKITSLFSHKVLECLVSKVASEAGDFRNNFRAEYIFMFNRNIYVKTICMLFSHDSKNDRKKR